MLAERRQREHAAWCAQLAARSGVPERYRAARLGDVSLVAEACRDRVSGLVESLAGLETTPAIIAVLGHRGAGKTHQACALVNHFCSLGRSAVIMSAMSFFLLVRATYRADAAETEDQVIERLVRRDLLVLDELHERGDTPSEDRLLHRLINRRYERLKPTVLISNQTQEQFARQVGESIVDRIREGGRIITCGWSSLRGGYQEGHTR